MYSKVGRGSTFWVELPLGVGVNMAAPNDELIPLGAVDPGHKLLGVLNLTQNLESRHASLNDEEASTACPACVTSSRSVSALQGILDQSALKLSLSQALLTSS